MEKNVRTDFVWFHRNAFTRFVSSRRNGKKRKEKKMREERVVKGHAFHPSAVWGKERKDLARLEYHTCPACRISGVMQTWAMLEGPQSSQAPSTSVHDWEKSRMYCYLPFCFKVFKYYYCFFQSSFTSWSFVSSIFSSPLRLVNPLRQETNIKDAAVCL